MRWIFANGFMLAAAALFFFISFGLEREYCFEVVVISIGWLLLIIIKVVTTWFYKQNFILNRGYIQ